MRSESADDGASTTGGTAERSSAPAPAGKGAVEVAAKVPRSAAGADLAPAVRSVNALGFALLGSTLGVDKGNVALSPDCCTPNRISRPTAALGRAAVASVSAAGARLRVRVGGAPGPREGSRIHPAWCFANSAIFLARGADGGLHEE